MAILATKLERYKAHCALRPCTVQACSLIGCRDDGSEE